MNAAILLATILALHAGAALKHQFVDRDGVLAAMVFGTRGRAPEDPGARFEVRPPRASDGSS